MPPSGSWRFSIVGCVAGSGRSTGRRHGLGVIRTLDATVSVTRRGPEDRTAEPVEQDAL
jgi:hypothetical protein